MGDRNCEMVPGPRVCMGEILAKNRKLEALSGQRLWIIVKAFYLIAPVFVSPDPFSGPTDAALNGLLM